MMSTINGRKGLAGFCPGFFAFEILEKGGLAFGLRDDNGFDEMYETLTMIRAYITMKHDPVGLPFVLRDDSSRLKKFQGASMTVQPIGEFMHTWHSQCGPSHRSRTGAWQSLRPIPITNKAKDSEIMPTRKKIVPK